MAKKYSCRTCKYLLWDPVIEKRVSYDSLFLELNGVRDCYCKKMSPGNNVIYTHPTGGYHLPYRFKTPKDCPMRK